MFENAWFLECSLNIDWEEELLFSFALHTTAGYKARFFNVDKSYVKHLYWISSMIILTLVNNRPKWQFYQCTNFGIFTRNYFTKIGFYQIKGKVTWIIWVFLTYVTHCSSVKLQARPNDKHFYVLTLWVVFDQQKFLNSWCSRWFVISSMPLNRHKVKEHRSYLY